MWVHPYFPGIEPPASGPGPVFNRSRRPDGVSNTREFVGDYTNPILKPKAAEVVKRHGDISLAGGAYPTPSNQCWPSGVPYIFFQIGVQLLQQPDKITILYLRDHEVRRVRMNESHPAHVTPSWVWRFDRALRRRHARDRYRRREERPALCHGRHVIAARPRLIALT